MKKLLILILLLNSIVLASEFDLPMKITLKDNTYILKSSCSYNLTNNTDFDNPYWNKKKYEFIFESKYHIFEKYYLLNQYNSKGLISFVTNLYTIQPIKVYADNKSVIHIFLSEEDFINIFKSSSVKINFNPVLFSSALLEKEYKNYRPNDRYVVGNHKSYIKPRITLSLNKNDLQSYLNDCSRDYNQYLSAYKQKEKDKKQKEIMIIIAISIVSIIFLIIIIKLIIKFKKKAKEKVITTVDEIKKEKRKDEIKTLIEDETIKGTIRKSFEFSEKSNINELQEAISDALKRNDVLEAQKLMDILKKITDK